MAWIDCERTGIFQIGFCFGGRRVKRSLRTRDQRVAEAAMHHLSTTLRDTRWKVIRGWHIFRHSFISNCASLAVDQRMIDAWVGHQPEDMRKRYRHLFPHRQRIELERVFGATTGEAES